MFRMTRYLQALANPDLAQRRPQVAAPTGPVVIWNLIRRCNLTCKHCYATSADKDFPGESHVGSCHYAPNSARDYDWGNERYVETHALDWRSYPKLRGVKVWMNCRDGWGPDGATHHKWWLGLLPKAPGKTKHGWNNWWIYIANFDENLEDLPPK